MRYLSVCSGIEAASAAWKPLGWEPVAFSEIEKFPSAVLAHHHPGVPNLGDMTKFHEWPDYKINLLVGGTPCQAFSVAGLREGLADPRGNLTLTFLGVADKYRPEWLVWENVPGVLSDRTNAFGQFLSGLGELGYGFAYRMLDAQYFGVAQRRRRMFVVGHLGDWRRAAAVLFEPSCLLGNPAPSREAREGIAPTISARTKGGGGLGTDFDCDGGCIPIQEPGKRTGRSTSDSACGIGIGEDGDKMFTLQAGAVHGVAHTLKGEGFDASEDGTGRGTPLVSVKWPASVPPTLDAHFGEKHGLEDQHINGGAGLFVPVARCVTTREGQCYDAQTTTLLAFNHNAQVDQMNFDPHTTPPLTCSQGAAVGFQDDPTIKISTEVIGALRADAGGQGACVQARMSVRRLTPTECERLQGFTTVVDRVVFDLCLDRQNSSVLVGVKCLRLPSSALRADAAASKGNALSAERGFGSDPEGLESAVHAHVRLLHEPRLHEIRSLGKLKWCASGAVNHVTCPQPIPPENFAVALAVVQQEADLLAGHGKVESPPSTTSFILPANGSWFAAVFGRESGSDASDVGANRHEEIMSITSSRGQKTSISRLTNATWLCSALNVIASCTQIETLIGNSAKLVVDIERDYTAIPWRKKPAEQCPDGPRYKALGNSMAVPCMKWIGNRIKKVAMMPEDLD